VALVEAVEVDVLVFAPDYLYLSRCVNIHFIDQYDTMTTATTISTRTTITIDEYSHSEPNHHHSLKRTFEACQTESEGHVAQEKHVHEQIHQTTSEFPVQTYTGISVEGE
jgi:hypothetical protein